jgi:ElaB/YqjD/DUF883 family membrane-anchored ribosome-binding protein
LSLRLSPTSSYFHCHFDDEGDAHFQATKQKELHMETTMNPTSNSALGKSSAQDQGVVDRAAAAVHGTVDKAAAAATPAVDKLAAGAHQIIDKVAEAAGTAAEMAGSKGEELMGQQQRLLEDCRGYARENPVSALVFAVAAGFLLSRLLSGR